MDIIRRSIKHFKKLKIPKQRIQQMPDKDKPKKQSLWKSNEAFRLLIMVIGAFFVGFGLLILADHLFKWKTVTDTFFA